MKILERDERPRFLKVKVESEEDLWVLYNVLREGDLVYAKTSRELKTRSRSRRKSMVLGIRVEWCKLQPLTSRLRVHGVIVEGPRELDLEGQRHTIWLDPGSVVTLVRDDAWRGRDLQAILEACKRSAPPVLVVALDSEEYCAAVVRDYSLDVAAEGAFKLPGKMDVEARKSALRNSLGTLASAIVDMVSRTGVEAVIIAGPGYIGQMLYERLEDRLGDVELLRMHAYSGGLPGVKEVLKRGAVVEILRRHELVVEEELLEEFMYVLAKHPERAAYGLDDVERAAKVGALEKLMVSSDLVRHYDEELRRRVEEVLRLAEEQGASIKIFGAAHDTKLKLKGLGGIAAILRYPVGAGRSR